MSLSLTSCFGEDQSSQLTDRLALLQIRVQTNGILPGRPGTVCIHRRLCRHLVSVGHAPPSRTAVTAGLCDRGALFRFEVYKGVQLYRYVSVVFARGSFLCHPWCMMSWERGCVRKLFLSFSSRRRRPRTEFWAASSLVHPGSQMEAMHKAGHNQLHKSRQISCESGECMRDVDLFLQSQTRALLTRLWTDVA